MLNRKMVCLMRPVGPLHGYNPIGNTLRTDEIFGTNDKAITQRVQQGQQWTGEIHVRGLYL